LDNLRFINKLKGNYGVRNIKHVRTDLSYE
jgi:hypothetical protein